MLPNGRVDDVVFFVDVQKYSLCNDCAELAEQPAPPLVVGHIAIVTRRFRWQAPPHRLLHEYGESDVTVQYNSIVDSAVERLFADRVVAGTAIIPGVGVTDLAIAGVQLEQQGKGSRLVPEVQLVEVKFERALSIYLGTPAAAIPDEPYRLFAI